MLSITVIIILITVIVSMMAFNDEQLLNKLLFWPYRMRSPASYYRFITSGFIHADYIHLIFNLFSFYFFAMNLEDTTYGIGATYMGILYLSGIVVANIPSYFRHRNNPYYTALGASGGVAAIIFAHIYLYPFELIRIFFAIPIPSVLFGILYLIYSAYMDKKSKDNIGHNAHFWGAVYGIAFMIIIDPSHGGHFLDQIKSLLAQ
jgi:membrane associated rhomboid family serine protease